jgi:hypothetical protein
VRICKRYGPQGDYRARLKQRGGYLLHFAYCGAAALRVDRLPAFSEIGGRDRDRTGDPLLAKQVLSQLSYTPTQACKLIF